MWLSKSWSATKFINCMTIIKNKLINILKSGGFKATPARVALLGALSNSKKPMSVEQITGKMKKIPDLATVYRALKEFEEAKIIARVSLKDGSGAYELLSGKSHHHHLVCTDCGVAVPLCI
jgi:Fe2+ or Zn2+ uptake regulation protein